MASEIPTTPIDLRDLPPPEPLLRILDLIESGEGASHVFLLPRAPAFLYPILRAEGWSFALRRLEDGFELTITRNLAKA